MLNETTTAVEDLARPPKPDKHWQSQLPSPFSDAAACGRSTSANFDPLARAYRWLEVFSFGPFLERCRLHFLPRMASARCVLLFGDGDGRFLARLLADDPADTDIAPRTVDAVDSSAAMLAELQRRVHSLGSQAQLTVHCGEARDFGPPRWDYDLVVTHFFLDCFSTEEVRALVGRVTPHLRPNAQWVLSEFAVPPAPIASLVARMVIGGLYRVFGLVTGLRVRSLPDHHQAFRDHGLALAESRSRLGGLLVSEVWTVPVVSPVCETSPRAGNR